MTYNVSIEATQFVRQGITPNWLETLLNQNLGYADIARIAAEKTGGVVSAMDMRSLAEYWGI